MSKALTLNTIFVVDVVWLLSCVWFFATSWTAACQTSCPSLSPRVCSNLYSLSQWNNPTLLSSVSPFSSCLQSFWVSESFPMSQLFISGGQSIGASASVSVLPMNIQGWFSLGLTDHLAVQGTLKSLFQQHVQKHQLFGTQLSLLYGPTHIYIVEKPYLRSYRPLSAKWCLCFLICCLGF